MEENEIDCMNAKMKQGYVSCFIGANVRHVENKYKLDRETIAFMFKVKNI